MRRLSNLAREQRRVILVLTDAELRIGRRDEDLVDYLDDDEAAVVSIPDSLSSDDPMVKRLSSQNRLRPGSLLIQSPYDPVKYEFADSAVTEFAVAKFMLLTKVSQRLGATSVKIDNIKTKAHRDHLRIDLKARAIIHSAGADLDRTLKHNVQERLQLNDTFSGGPPDIDGARQLLEIAGLSGDATLESLVDMRADGNALTKRVIKLSLTQESSQNLHVAVKYSGLKAVRVEANFTRQVEENVDVVLEATVTFPAA